MTPAPLRCSSQPHACAYVVSSASPFDLREIAFISSRELLCVSIPPPAYLLLCCSLSTCQPHAVTSSTTEKVQCSAPTGAAASDVIGFSAATELLLLIPLPIHRLRTQPLTIDQNCCARRVVTHISQQKNVFEYFLHFLFPASVFLFFSRSYSDNSINFSPSRLSHILTSMPILRRL